MNLSGDGLAAWAREQGVPAMTEGPFPWPLLVVCDDLNLPLGSLRLRAGGGSGGQNGLASILETLGTEEVPRLRLGIAPVVGEVPSAEWAEYVLAEFEPQERTAAEDLVSRAAAAVDNWRLKGLTDTVARFGRRIRPAAAPDPEDPDADG